jgi:3-mercaptopyruvate sulfurtransferase SseA
MLSVVARAGVLVAASAALGLTFNAVRPDGLALGAFAPPATCVVSGAGAGAGSGSGSVGARVVEVLPPVQAVRLCGDTGVLIADARPAGRFAEGHIVGALHLPCAARGSEATSALERMRDKHTVVVYGDTTAEARPVADDLRRRVGRPAMRVVVIDGGFAAWNGAGLACSSGPCPHCTDTAQASQSRQRTSSPAGRRP